MGLRGLSIRPADCSVQEGVSNPDPRPLRVWALDASLGRDAARFSPPGGYGNDAISGCPWHRAGGAVGPQRWSRHRGHGRDGSATALREANPGSVSFSSEKAGVAFFLRAICRASGRSRGGNEESAQARPWRGAVAGGITPELQRLVSASGSGPAAGRGFVRRPAWRATGTYAVPARKS